MYFSFENNSSYIYICRDRERIGILLGQLAGAAEYTNCISAEWEDFPNECPRYDIKQSDGEASVMIELWGVQSTPSLPLLPCPLWPGVVAPDSVLSICQIELNCVITPN